METKAMRKMELVDFLNLPSMELLAYWLKDQCDSDSVRGTTSVFTPDVDLYQKVLASFDALGREGVSHTLAEAGFHMEVEETKILRLQDAKGILTKMKNQQDFRIFTSEFVKKGDGTLRKMRCRFGVTKYLRGGKKFFEDSDYDLTTVFDLDAPPDYNKAEKERISKGELIERAKGAYRSINIEGLVRLTVAGRKYIIEENKDKVDLLRD